MNIAAMPRSIPTSPLYTFLGLLRCANAQIELWNSTTLQAAAPLSAKCSSALEAAVNCDPALQLYATSQYVGAIDMTVLSNQLCPAACASSLASWHKSVASACANDPQHGSGFPATYEGDFLWAYQNQTCLKDSSTGEYCIGKMR